MKIDELNVFLRQRLNISAQRTRDILAVVQRIGVLHGGPVLHDKRKKPSAQVKREYAEVSAIQALNMFARRCAQSLRPPLSDVYARRASAVSSSLPFVFSGELASRVNLNAAGAMELEALPGIGPVTAIRIGMRVAQIGAFSKYDELKEIKGIGKKQIAAFQNLTYLGPKTRKPVLRSPVLDQFIDDPSFENYLRALQAHLVGPYNSREAILLQDFGDVLLQELRGFESDLMAYRYRRNLRRPGITSSRLTQRSAARRRGSKILKGKIANQSNTVLIDDSAYRGFVLELLKKATSDVSVVMFFMVFSERASHPANALVEALVQAKKRGAIVKVILDIDGPDDFIGSREVNEAAFKYLKRNRVDVRYDSPERYTHSKIVVVDGAHVVVGSHNWTAGSFYRYQDTSLYVHSQELADYYTVRFDSLSAAAECDAVVAHGAAPEADQDRREGGSSRPIRRVSTYRGCGAASDVPGNP